MTVTQPGHDPVDIDLVGTNLRIDPATERVTLDVAVRNASDRDTLLGVWIWIGCFEPGGVWILNADGGRRYAGCLNWGFGYRGAAGDDGVLFPGETSAAKPWTFHDPGLGAFSFGAHPEFELGSHPRIAGIVFHDGNRNGRRDSFEDPFESAAVSVRGPGGASFTAVVRPDGSWSVPITQPGLYSVDAAFGGRCPCEPLECCTICVTTRHPLEIVLPPDHSGRPQSYLRAHFGMTWGACDDPSPPVVLVRAPRDSIPQDPYALLDARLEGDDLVLRVGYSGCSAVQPFTLYAGRSFMESNPVQTWVVLSHYGRQPCDAYFEADLRFELDPIRWAHTNDYGAPGIVILRFTDFRGIERMYRFSP